MKKTGNGILTSTDMKQNKYKLLYVSISVFIIIACVVAAAPVVWMTLLGFKDVKEIYELPVRFIPEHINLGKLAVVWKEVKIYKYYLSTLIMSVGAVISTCLVTGLGGYALSRIRPKGTKLILTLLVWLMLMPGTMRTVPLYMEFKKLPIFGFNLLNTFWPMWILAASSIFNVILFKNFFDGISASLIEAARIDGASDLRIFFQIIMPLSMPVLMTVSIFTFNGHFGSFFWPFLTITSDKLTVLGVFVYKLKSSSLTLDYQMVATLFSMLPQLIIFIIFQKQIIGGVNIGGVKG